MIKRYLPLVMMILMGLLVPLHAQNSDDQDDDNGITDDQTRNRFWQCSVGGGDYLVALSRISAVSRHQYILDGTLLVDEVTVDSTGQALVRFYYIEPIQSNSGTGNAAQRLVDRGKELVERGSEVTGSDAHNMVHKKFPVTTHAKQVEFRVLSKQALGALYGSVKTAWVENRGRSFSIR